MDHVKLHTPVSTALSSGINCFEVKGLSAGEVVNRLHERNIVASTTPYRVSYPRLTPCIINTKDEAKACIEVVAALKG